MQKTYHGSCHCGAVRFEADIDLETALTLRCNCSICFKARYWPAIIGHERFRLLAGEGDLALYQFASKTDFHYHCKHCGIRPFGTGTSSRWGPFRAVSLSCLDDVSDQELAAAPITYLDGRHDNWDGAPAETRFL